MADTYDSTNIWDKWFPEDRLAAVLAGDYIVADCGQVRGVWAKQLKTELRAGRIVKWRGHWFPVAGASWGIGPLKTCYGTEAARDFVCAIPFGCDWQYRDDPLVGAP